jgi:hypothetical protein
MALDKGFKSRIVLVVDERRKQLPIRGTCPIRTGNGPVKMRYRCLKLSHYHTDPPWSVAPDLHK